MTNVRKGNRFPKHPPVVANSRQRGRKPSFYDNDETLQLLLKQYLDKDFFEYASERLRSYGELCANEIDERARFTDREGEPQLIKYNEYGEEVSEIWVNEGYKKTVEQTYNEGIVGYVHKRIPELNEKGNYTYSFAQGYVLSQAEPGFYCPVTLTLATAYLLDHYGDESVKDRFLHNVCSTGERPLFEGATFLTERQGGSDVGANETVAIQDGDTYKIYGEKYFASNAGMAGIAMVLARIEGSESGSRGLSLFAVPWRNEDGSLNNVTIRRLKDKLGVKAVPSAEIEYHGATAYLVGDPKKGFYYMMEALNLSRVSNAIASVGIMKRAYDEAFDYATRRSAFGNRLTKYPMVQDTLMRMKAKLHVETATIFDMIQLYEKVTSKEGQEEVTEEEIVLNRLNIAMIKKETAYQAIHFAHEAIEMHGGNGYIEDFVAPRLLRDAQVLSVWEGTANILGLEVVRLFNRFNGAELYVKQMEERLIALKESPLYKQVAELFDGVKMMIEKFSSLNYDEQTFYSKQLSKTLNSFYETVVAVEWANRYGDKYEAIAEIFIEHEWNLREIGDEMITVKYFDLITKESDE